MDSNEIAPQPVTTVEELYGKLDMLLEAAKQRTETTDDTVDEVGVILLARLMEVKNDLSIVDDKPEHWAPVGIKLEAIGNAIRERTINDLNASYSMDPGK